MANHYSMEETVQRLRDKIPSAYEPNFEEMKTLFDLGNKNVCEAVLMAFDYGFIKGTRAHNNKKTPVLY